MSVEELTPSTFETGPLKRLEIRIFPLDENEINPRSKALSKLGVRSSPLLLSSFSLSLESVQGLM